MKLQRHNDLQNFYPTSTDVIYSATFFWLVQGDHLQLCQKFLFISQAILILMTSEGCKMSVAFQHYYPGPYGYFWISTLRVLKNSLNLENIKNTFKNESNA